jgi:SAM-dependent methyltransferase
MRTFGQLRTDRCGYNGSMVYLHPLAYLVGVEGVALLRAFAGEYDRDFTEARLAEVRALLGSSTSVGQGTEAQLLTVVDAYRAWADFYDKPGNGLFDPEQSIVWGILDGLPRGVALDAACGTGRHAEHLAFLGHRVIGVDISPDMLARARGKIPAGEFHEADLHHLPLAEDSVDIVVCAFALTHIPELAPVFAEFARVLRTGGHLVVSDVRGLFSDGIHSPLARAGADGGPAYLRQRRHLTSDYLSAAIPLGLQVRRCVEPRMSTSATRPADSDLAALRQASINLQPDIYSLHRWCPAAVNAAYRDIPVMIIWHFQLTDDTASREGVHSQA